MLMAGAPTLDGLTLILLPFDHLPGQSSGVLSFKFCPFQMSSILSANPTEQLDILMVLPKP